MVTYIRTGRKSSAPAGTWFPDIDTLRSKLLMTLQQLKTQRSFSRGALKALIFFSSFSASCEKRNWRYFREKRDKLSIKR